MSAKLEAWKRQTVLQVRMAGAISARTGLEMMDYIARLESKLQTIHDIAEGSQTINSFQHIVKLTNIES